MSSLTISAPIVIGTSLANASAATTLPVIPVAPQTFAGAAGLNAINAGSAAGDTDTAANTPVAAPQLYSGTQTNTWARQRGTENQTVLPSAVYTTTQTTGDFTNYNFRGAIVYWNITAVGAAASLAFFIDAKDTLGVYFPLVTSTQTTTGAKLIIAYAGSASGNVILPRVFRIRVTHNNATNNTYSIGMDLVL